MSRACLYLLVAAGSLALGRPSVAAPAVTVAGPRVLLGDLLGNGADDQTLDLGAAPAPGGRRRIYRRQVLAVLGAEARGRGGLPSHWDVVTRGRELSCAELTRAVEEALAPSLPEGLTLLRLACSQPIGLPVGELQLEARLAEGARTAGRVNVTVELRVGAWPARRLTLGAQIEGSGAVVVAAREIAPGAALGPDDLRIEHRSASALPGDCLRARGEAEGKRSLVRLHPGALLRRGSLAEVPLIIQGGTVTVAAELQGLRVTSRGTARQDGRRGDTILVLCASGRLVKARVVGPHLAVVDL